MDKLSGSHTAASTSPATNFHTFTRAIQNIAQSNGKRLKDLEYFRIWRKYADQNSMTSNR